MNVLGTNAHMKLLLARLEEENRQKPTWKERIDGWIRRHIIDDFEREYPNDPDLL